MNIEVNMEQLAFDVLTAAGPDGLTMKELITSLIQQGNYAEMASRGRIGSMIRAGIFTVEDIPDVRPWTGQSRVRVRLVPDARRPVGHRGRKGVQNQERLEAMVLAFVNGETMAQIGKRFDLTRERVRQLLAKHGVTIRRDRTIAELVERVRRLEEIIFVQREKEAS